MPVRRRTFAVVLVATIALATTWALAAAVQPAAHRFVKGEHFRYSNVLTTGGGDGDGVISSDGPQTLGTVDDIDVIGVSPTGAVLAYHVQPDRASIAKASAVSVTKDTPTIRVGRDGTWRYPDGRIADNFVIWDRGELGPQPTMLFPRQHWAVETPRSASSETARAVVRVVSVDPDNLALHVEGKAAPVPYGGAAQRITNTWYADVVFAHGIVRELHRVDVARMDRGPGTHGEDFRFERRVRLLTYTTP